MALASSAAEAVCRAQQHIQTSRRGGERYPQPQAHLVRPSTAALTMRDDDDVDDGFTSDHGSSWSWRTHVPQLLQPVLDVVESGVRLTRTHDRDQRLTVVISTPQSKRLKRAHLVLQVLLPELPLLADTSGTCMVTDSVWPPPSLLMPQCVYARVRKSEILTSIFCLISASACMGNTRSLGCESSPPTPCTQSQ